jgi:medium-chain acyl-[acyl-carrier-protein] hydrolase
MKHTKLFCFSYAGGSAAIYYSWKKYFSNRFEVIPIEFSGRGSRFFEPLFQSMDEMLEDLHLQIHKHMDGSQFALFGHSLGGLLAYELAYKLKERYGILPHHLFISAHSAPHIEKDCKKLTYSLPQEQFLEEVAAMGGTPPQFFEEPDLQKLFIPVLRADFRISEMYCFTEKLEPLQCDITLFTGSEDDGVEGDIFEWKQHTGRKFAFYEFEGDHFFIHEHKEAMIEIIKNHLLD